MRIYKLENGIQNYAWGDKKFIPELLGFKNKDSKPYAELWMGAHPKMPSKVIEGSESMGLDAMIEADPEIVLGESVAESFNNRLPFLFKVLSAGAPLSIQAHPDKKSAEEGFERENSLGIPLDAPHRNYKDDNHKPEIICALTPFTAMKGFRKYEEIVRLFIQTGIAELKVLVSSLEKNQNPDGLKQFFADLFEVDPLSVKKIISELKKSLKGRSELEFKWVLKLISFYPEDIGVLAPLYLNLVELNPGDALYLGAGELHAYLQGSGMELMANSDNVLRGGLTPKHIDLKELNSVLKFEPSNYDVITPSVKGVEKVYETPSFEFELSRLDVAGEVCFGPEKSVSILICSKGSIDITDGSGRTYSVSRGDTVLAAPGMDYMVLKGEGELYRASVPEKV